MRKESAFRSPVFATVFLLCQLAAAQLLAPPAAKCDSLFEGAECVLPTSMASQWNYQSGKPIYLYVEKDMAAEFSACLPASSTAAVDESRMRTIVMAAAEAWNRESRAAPLVWGGTIDKDDLYWAKDYMRRPGIFIHFRPACVNSSGNCNGVGQFQNLGYTDVAEITIRGSSADPNGCTSGKAPWGTGDGSWGSFDLQSNLTHELGHALGLGHPTTIGDNAVMKGAGHGVRDRHLYPWDMDCADEPAYAGRFTGWIRNERTVRHYWIDHENLPGANPNWGATMIKGFTSGNMLRRSQTQNYFGLFEDGDVRYGSSAGPSYDLTSWGPPSPDSLYQLFIGPSLMSPVEKAGTDQRHRINYNNPAGVDPPALRYVRSDNIFEANDPWGNYRSCESWTNCLSAPVLRSHVPLLSTYDPQSDVTVFAHVETDRDSQADHGVIYLHPGFRGSSNYLLSPGSRTADFIQAPSGGYTLRTDAAPALACSSDDLSPNEPYNCLLAWTDRGEMNGRVLYTWFRVNSSGRLEYDGRVYVRSWAYSAGNVSAGIASDGSFLLAWKTSRPSDVAYTVNAGACRTCWGSVTKLGRERVVDAPTWLYDQYTAFWDGLPHNAVLVWTEADP